MHIIEALNEMVGQGAVADGLASLPADARAALTDINAVTWVPLSAFNQFIDETARMAKRDPEPMIDEAIRNAARRTFSTVWRMFLRVTTDEAMIKRTPVLHAKARNVGQMSSRIDVPGAAQVTLTDWPDIGDRTLRTIGVGIVSVLELAGRRDVRISYSRTPEGGRYELRWRV